MEQVLSIFNPWWATPTRAEGIKRLVYLRELSKKRSSRDVVFITGLRRVGKTTLVKQYLHQMITEGTDPKRIVYFSMDHPVLVKESILDILDAYRRMQGLKHDDDFTVFIDEVHMRDGFEQELKTVYDLGHVKVFATGSSSIFIAERGAGLAGRQTFIEVYPFGFSEYMTLRGVKVRQSDVHLMVRYAEEYVRCGGLPEYITSNDPGYITTLLDSILYKDLVTRHGVKNATALRELVIIITQSVGSKLSPRKVARVLGLSHESVRDYMSYLAEANLLHTVRLHGKVSESMASLRKVYVSDTGIVNVISPTINIGSIVENCVYNALRPTGDIRYGLVGGREVDFIVGEVAYEVKYQDNISTDDVANLKKLDVDRRVVVTRNQRKTVDGLEFVPLWRFLLSLEPRN